jgi:uncharacterized membrane protein YfcA
VLHPPLPWALLAASLLVIAGAGVVRGFAGFGFSALSVAGLSLLMSPAKVVPAIFVLEIVASLSLLRSALRDVDGAWLSWLVVGNVVGTPLGIAALAALPETPLRLLIGLLLGVAALLLRLGFSVALQPTRTIRLGTGLVCGVVNGLAAIGGIAVAVLLSTARMPPAAMRATLIALFLFTDLYALAWAAVFSGDATGNRVPLLGADTIAWAAWLAPAMLLGIAIGQRAFSGVSPERFRRHVLTTLLVISSLTVLRALQALAA